jgi:hypothetical protein
MILRGLEWWIVYGDDFQAVVTKRDKCVLADGLYVISFC